MKREFKIYLVFRGKKEKRRPVLPLCVVSHVQGGESLPR